LGLNDKIERVSVANDLASYLGVESGLVLEHFRKMAADRADRPAAPPKADPAKATEQRLLLLLLNNEEARAQLIDSLRDLPARGPVFETLIAMHDAHDAIDFNSLHERLAQAEQERLAEIVLTADGTGLTVEDGTHCVEAFRREAKEAAKRELKARIKAAEREGRMREAIELMGRLSELG